MWRLLRRWCGGTPRKVFTLLCGGWGKPRVAGVEFHYHLAGISVVGEPIPWCADHVQVEALIAPAGHRATRKGDFSLRVLNEPGVDAAELVPESPDSFRLVFQLPPLRRPTEVRLCWQGSTLAELTLPFVSAEEFLGRLRLEAVVLGCLPTGVVPCQVVMGEQLRGLVACGLLVSPTSLVPLLDLGVTAEFADASTGRVEGVAPVLPRSHVQGHRAFLSAVPRGQPEAGDAWLVRWLVGGRCLASSLVRARTPEDFDQSLYLVDAGYTSQGPYGPPTFHPSLPPRHDLGRIGPCFRLASRESGAAALCPLELRIHWKDPARPPTVVRQEVLITDAPSPFMPHLMSAGEFEQVASFELLRGGRLTGTLPGCVPRVRFTSEGGFTELADIDWTPVAEDDLNECLRSLMEAPDPFPAV
jgi:hypothetical protein